jgi:ABC-2 type transport system ATP-binding protein
MNAIEIKNLTMKYPSGKGVSNIDLSVDSGRVVGFLGPNGAGKTTTIRCLLGFLKGQSGTCAILGRDCFAEAPENMKHVGYIAGEPSFPEAMTGSEYLGYVIETRSQYKDRGEMTKRMRELCEYFEFDASGKIKKMSKGMKQKVAVVACFMHDPDIYIIDEPTSGLDPLMQNKFVELVLAEKAKGKTIFISSHIFEEVERTCDEVVIIKDGKIVLRGGVKTLKMGQKKTYVAESENAGKIKIAGADVTAVSDNKIEIAIPYDKIDGMIKELGKHTVTNLELKEASIESVFMHLYGKEEAQV